MEDHAEKISIGVSSCLIGEKVRWDGDHKQDDYVTNVLGNYFAYVAVCPEVEAGMGVPREAVGLYGRPDAPAMLGKTSGTEWTAAMHRYCKNRVKELSRLNLCGFIFKSRSPSCGWTRVPVYGKPGNANKRRGRGLFADTFLKRYPLIPVADEESLNDPGSRENFIVRVFGFFRLQNMLNSAFSRRRLVDFHTRHKYLILAHSRKHYSLLGRLVADVKKWTPGELKTRYSLGFMEALSFQSTAKKNADVLHHMLGFLKKNIASEARQDILAAIEDYRGERAPLIVPVTLLRHHARKHNITYLLDQVYLNPHPGELMLRNHV